MAASSAPSSRASSRNYQFSDEFGIDDLWTCLQLKDSALLYFMTKFPSDSNLLQLFIEEQEKYDQGFREEAKKRLNEERVRIAKYIDAIDRKNTPGTQDPRKQHFSMIQDAQNDIANRYLSGAKGNLETLTDPQTGEFYERQLWLRGLENTPFEVGEKLIYLTDDQKRKFRERINNLNISDIEILNHMAQNHFKVSPEGVIASRTRSFLKAKAQENECPQFIKVLNAFTNVYFYCFRIRMAIEETFKHRGFMISTPRMLPPAEIKIEIALLWAKKKCSPQTRQKGGSHIARKQTQTKRKGGSHIAYKQPSSSSGRQRSKTGSAIVPRSTRIQTKGSPSTAPVPRKPHISPPLSSSINSMEGSNNNIPTSEELSSFFISNSTELHGLSESIKETIQLLKAIEKVLAEKLLSTLDKACVESKEVQKTAEDVEALGKRFVELKAPVQNLKNDRTPLEEIRRIQETFESLETHNYSWKILPKHEFSKLTSEEKREVMEQSDYCMFFLINYYTLRKILETTSVLLKMMLSSRHRY